MYGSQKYRLIIKRGSPLNDWYTQGSAKSIDAKNIKAHATDESSSEFDYYDVHYLNLAIVAISVEINIWYASKTTALP